MKNDRDEYKMENVVRVQAGHGEEPETGNHEAVSSLGGLIVAIFVVVIAASIWSKPSL